MTVYIPDDLYEEVKAQPDLNASAICQAALRRELDARKGMSRVVLFDSGCNKSLAFKGRKIEVKEPASEVGLAGGLARQTRSDAGRRSGRSDLSLSAREQLLQGYDIYVTAKGNLAVYDKHAQNLESFSGLSEMSEAHNRDFVAMVAELLGDDLPPDPNIEELDI